MKTINLRDFYYWYDHDEYIEVSDEVVAELFKGRRYEDAHDRRMRRNKSYSLDVEADIETASFVCSTDDPEALVLKMEQHCRLCRALNSLPEIQGRRIEAHYILGMSQRDIAEDEGVNERNVRLSISKGLASMKKYLQNCPEGYPICPSK